jgi:hypothetical protein
MFARGIAQGSYNITQVRRCAGHGEAIRIICLRQHAQCFNEGPDPIHLERRFALDQCRLAS